jgi:hypothetical protein
MRISTQKRDFSFLLRFIFQGDHLEVQVGPERKSFNVTLTNPEAITPDSDTLKPIFHYMVDSLVASLGIRLWERAKKPTIGYIEFGESQA